MGGGQRIGKEDIGAGRTGNFLAERHRGRNKNRDLSAVRSQTMYYHRASLRQHLTEDRESSISIQKFERMLSIYYVLPLSKQTKDFWNPAGLVLVKTNKETNNIC